jgi:plastocyanin
MKKTLILCSAAIFFSSAGFAETHTVGQKDKAFTKSQLTVKKGDTVNFVNEDDIFHNVFSLSDAKFFDLGSYPKGESKEVEFDEVGIIEVECAIHPEMIMEVVVEE